MPYPFTPRSILRVGKMPKGYNPRLRCQFCLSEQDADGMIRVEWPDRQNPGMAHFVDLFVCGDCAEHIGLAFLGLSNEVEKGNMQP